MQSAKSKLHLIMESPTAEAQSCFNLMAVFYAGDVRTQLASHYVAIASSIALLRGVSIEEEGRARRHAVQ